LVLFPAERADLFPLFPADTADFYFPQIPQIFVSRRLRIFFPRIAQIFHVRKIFICEICVICGKQTCGKQTCGK